MSRVAFRRADMERVFKAAGRAKAFVQIDMKTLIATIIPSDQQNPVDEEGNPLGILLSGNYAPRWKGKL